MARMLLLLALCAAPAFAADPTSFEIGCYHASNVAGESGSANGRSYRGLVTSTHSGRTCKKWTATNQPEGSQDVFDDDGTVEWGNGLGNHNYCRNPSGNDAKPWCFTVDPKVGKEECEIPECPAHARD